MFIIITKLSISRYLGDKLGLFHWVNLCVDICHCFWNYDSNSIDYKTCSVYALKYVFDICHWTLMLSSQTVWLTMNLITFHLYTLFIYPPPLSFTARARHHWSLLTRFFLTHALFFSFLLFSPELKGSPSSPISCLVAASAWAENSTELRPATAWSWHLMLIVRMCAVRVGALRPGPCIAAGRPNCIFGRGTHICRSIPHINQSNIPRIIPNLTPIAPATNELAYLNADMVPVGQPSQDREQGEVNFGILNDHVSTAVTLTNRTRWWWKESKEY